MTQIRSVLTPRPLNRRHWLEISDMVRFALRRLREEQLPQVSSSLTFTSVLALVPMLIVALAIFTTFPAFNSFRTSLEAYFIKSLMPQSIANTILGYLGQFAAKASRLSMVGAVMLVVTSVAMLNTIDRVFNHIWRVKTRRPRTQRMLMYWAIATLGPLLVGISMSLTSYVFTATNDAVMRIPVFGALFYTLLAVALTTGAFTLLYMAVPNRFVEWRDAAWGGLVAAIAFEIAKRIFAVFVAKFPTYTVLYGALAALPIFLVWIYVSWMITLVGAVIAASLPIYKYERWWHVPTPGSAFVDAVAVLAVLHDARATGGSAAVDGSMLRALTQLGFEESETLLVKMLDAGWVARITIDVPRHVQWGKRVTDGMDCWTLLANPDRLSLADVYRLFMFAPGATSPAANTAAHSRSLAQHTENVIEQGLSQTLTGYFASLQQVKTMPAPSTSAST